MNSEFTRVFSQWQWINNVTNLTQTVSYPVRAPHDTMLVVSGYVSSSTTGEEVNTVSNLGWGISGTKYSVVRHFANKDHWSTAVFAHAIIISW